MTNYIWVTFEKDGFHNWPNALPDVYYLKNKHWHVFKYKVFIEVKSNDREIEFHMFRKYVMGLVRKWPRNLRHNSCEMLANDIAKHIIIDYPNRKIIIEVSEDGINGVTMEYSNQ